LTVRIIYAVSAGFGFKKKKRKKVEVRMYVFFFLICVYSIEGASGYLLWDTSLVYIIPTHQILLHCTTQCHPVNHWLLSNTFTVLITEYQGEDMYVLGEESDENPEVLNRIWFGLVGYRWGDYS